MKLTQIARGLWNRITARNSLEDSRLSLDDPATWDGILSRPSESGADVTPQTALGYPPFWRGCNLICNDVGKLPIELYERVQGGREIAVGHPARRLLKSRPNEIMTALDLKKTVTLHALLRGNGFAAIIRDRADDPQELLILDPDNTCMAIVNGQATYMTKAGGNDVKIAARDVLHIKGLSHDGLWGIDVVDCHRNSLGLGIAARSFGSQFFANGSNASGVLMVPGSFTPEKVRNTIQAWNEMTTGLKNSHKVALLQDGAKFQQLTITPEAAQFLETRQFEIRECANIFGLPPHKLGDNSATSYNSLEQENQSLIDEALDPWLCAWESQAEKLLDDPEREYLYFEFNREARLRTDTASRHASYKTLREIGVLSANDVCRMENRPLIPGPAGDRRYVPANWVPMDQEARPATNAAREPLQALIADRLETMQTLAANKAEQARERGYNLPQWHADFAGKFADTMAAALDSTVATAWALLCPSKCHEDTLQRFLAKSTERRQAALSAVDDETDIRALFASLDDAADLMPPMPPKGLTHADQN